MHEHVSVHQRKLRLAQLADRRQESECELAAHPAASRAPGTPTTPQDEATDGTQLMLAAVERANQRTRARRR